MKKIKHAKALEEIKEKLLQAAKTAVVVMLILSVTIGSYASFGGETVKAVAQDAFGTVKSDEDETLSLEDVDSVDVVSFSELIEKTLKEFIDVAESFLILSMPSYEIEVAKQSSVALPQDVTAAGVATDESTRHESFSDISYMRQNDEAEKIEIVLTTQKPTEAPTSAPATSHKDESAYVKAASVNTVSVKKAPDDLMLDENGVPLNYSYIVTGNASAYAGDPITATGTVPEPGSIAVNPRIIPYGTKMWIISDDGAYIYGYAVAEDTGGFIYWRKAPIADLFFWSESACNIFGRRDITIYVLS